MAKKLTTIVLLCLVVALLLVESHAEIGLTPTGAPAPAPAPTPTAISMDGITEGSLQPQDCAPRCEERCSKTHHKKPCLFYCEKCCAKCLCVPPGTYGNKEVCPCYNNWKTKEGGPKCP